jgi:hypothetical protein
MAARIGRSNDKRHNNEIRWLVEQELRSSEAKSVSDFKGLGESTRLRTLARKHVWIDERALALAPLAQVVLKEPSLLFSECRSVPTRLDVQEIGTVIDTHVRRIDVVSCIRSRVLRSVGCESDINASTRHRRPGDMGHHAI